MYEGDRRTCGKTVGDGTRRTGSELMASKAICRCTDEYARTLLTATPSTKKCEIHFRLTRASRTSATR
eukprot:4475943-Pyramimonas_sp.AAC.1